jgi:hypothetical protein
MLNTCSCSEDVVVVPGRLAPLVVVVAALVVPGPLATLVVVVAALVVPGPLAPLVVVVAALVVPGRVVVVAALVVPDVAEVEVEATDVLTADTFEPVSARSEVVDDRGLEDVVTPSRSTSDSSVASSTSRLPHEARSTPAARTTARAPFFMFLTSRRNLGNHTDRVAATRMRHALGRRRPMPTRPVLPW